MTTMTWTTTAASVPSAKIGTFVMPVLKKIGHFIAVCAGAYAAEDSNYRGLDLNGNPIWVVPHKH